MTRTRTSRWQTRFTTLAAVAVFLLGGVGAVYAQEATPTAGAGMGEVDDGAPAPPSIGADIPLTYFGPAPSQVQKELIGPYQLLKSGTIDTDAGTIKLPLYHGHMTDGRDVWYILTDTTDVGNAAALGLNLSNKLMYADVGKGARTATIDKDATLTFDSG